MYYKDADIVQKCTQTLGLHYISVGCSPCRDLWYQYLHCDSMFTRAVGLNICLCLFCTMYSQYVHTSITLQDAQFSWKEKCWNREQSVEEQNLKGSRRRWIKWNKERLSAIKRKNSWRRLFSFIVLCQGFSCYSRCPLFWVGGQPCFWLRGWRWRKADGGL